jgi:hypothetical protein
MEYQFNISDDAALELWERDLARIAAKQAELEDEHGKIWEAIFAMFDRNGLSGEAARYVAGDGFALVRVKAQMSETLDVAAIEAYVRSRGETPAAGARLWAAVSEPVHTRVLSQAKLAYVIERGRLPREAVITKGGGYQMRRLRRPASKEDLEALALRNIALRMRRLSS